MRGGGSHQSVSICETTSLRKIFSFRTMARRDPQNHPLTVAMEAPSEHNVPRLH